MKRKSVSFSKPSGGERIPVTTRIEWMPDGTIRPLLFWTADGTCLEVVSLLESTPLSFLKERGEGLRFKVCAEIIEIEEPHTDMLHTRHETYLHLADRRFSERNIIDERYGHAAKEFIPVTLDVFPGGDYELVYFTARGLRYAVERTEEVAPRGSFHAGGIGIRHKVEARLVNADNDDDPDPAVSVVRPAALYLELNKWFVPVGTA